MTNILTPDICVIGAGSGGLSVAAAAAAFGVEVVLIEKHKMGGDCLNYGCVPSKALLAAGKAAQSVREGSKFGVVAGELKIDFKQVNAHVHDVIAAIEPHDSVERFTGLGVNVILAEATFKDAGTVVAGDHEIKARRFVIATGSSPFVPPIEGLDEVPYFTNETIFDNDKPIDHLIIIGGGPIGLELAQAHHRLGCEVTVIEGARFLGQADPELVPVVIDNFREEGIQLLEGAKVLSVSKKGKSGIEVTVEEEGATRKINGSAVLVATGRKPNTDGLDLEKAGIEFDRRGVTVSSDLRTTNKRVYAIGDVAGGPQFTHVAGYHAGLVIRGLLFRLRAKPDHSSIPWVIFTDPEVAHAGLDESTAREQHGDSIQVLRWPYKDNDRAQAERKTTGMIKLIATKRGRILGVSIVGANAGEMINMWSLAISKRLKLGDVAGYISPYPTMAEIGKRAAVTSFAPLAKKPLVRKVIGMLRKFG